MKVKHYNNIQSIEDRAFSRNWYRTVPGFLSGVNKRAHHTVYSVKRAASQLGHNINQATGGRVEKAIDAVKSAKDKVIKPLPHFARDQKEPLRNLTDYQLKRKTIKQSDKFAKEVKDAWNNPQKTAGKVARMGVENPLLGVLYGSAALNAPGTQKLLQVPGINGATIALGKAITPRPIQRYLRKTARADYGKLTNNVKNSISNATNNVKNNINSVTDKVSDKVNTLKDRVKNFLNFKQQPKP